MQLDQMSVLAGAEGHGRLTRYRLKLFAFHLCTVLFFDCQASCSAWSVSYKFAFPVRTNSICILFVKYYPQDSFLRRL